MRKPKAKLREWWICTKCGQIRDRECFAVAHNHVKRLRVQKPTARYWVHVREVPKKVRGK